MQGYLHESPPQFTLRAFLVAMLVVGAFFGGIRFERERRRREDEARPRVILRFEHSRGSPMIVPADELE